MFAVVVRWRAWVCGSARWRSEFMDWHGGACGFVVINVCGGHQRLWWSVEAVGCGRGLCSRCDLWLWLRCGSWWLWVESFQYGFDLAGFG